MTRSNCRDAMAFASVQCLVFAKRPSAACVARCIFAASCPAKRRRPSANTKRDIGEEGMAFPHSFSPAMPAAVLFAVLSLATGARALDQSQYPDFSGIWRKPAGIGNQWDQTKPLGRAQEPPLTPEYQAIFEAS